MKCSGLYTALPTPFKSDGTLDEQGFCFLIQRQLKAHVDGLLVLGTTGESSTLNLEEKKQLIMLAHQEAPNTPLLVGCGSNSTRQTLENIEQAATWGAHFALVISPYYNKPPQEGLFQHFKILGSKSALPILLYNHPGRTGVNLELETLKRLVELPNIIGIKETSGDLTQITQTLYTLKQIRPNFSLFSGDDNLAFAVRATGGDGVISGSANLIPHLMMELVHNDLKKASELNLFLTPLFEALTLQSNPIPLKAALQMCRFPSGDPRLPLVPLAKEHISQLEKALESLNLLTCVV